jgi:hypothetical protein
MTTTVVIFGGTGKIQALRQVVLPQPDTTMLPVSLIRPNHGKMTRFADSEAVSLLPEAIKTN